MNVPFPNLEAAPPPNSDCARSWVQWYYAQGLSIVPVSGGHKRPSINWRQFSKNIPTPLEIQTFWPKAEGADGIALICGQVSGGIFVVDIDEGPGKIGSDSFHDLCMKYDDLPITWTARTGGGGRHFFFGRPKASGSRMGPTRLARTSTQGPMAGWSSCRRHAMKAGAITSG